MSTYYFYSQEKSLAVVNIHTQLSDCVDPSMVHGPYPLSSMPRYPQRGLCWILWLNMVPNNWKCGKSVTVFAYMCVSVYLCA